MLEVSNFMGSLQLLVTFTLVLTDDKEAVEQIVNWADSQASSAVKYVISSASGFTDDARKRADDKDVVLIGGLQTMCFLLGIPERYRSDWERPETPKEVI